jgi:hypothetical protein
VRPQFIQLGALASPLARRQALDVNRDRLRQTKALTTSQIQSASVLSWRQDSRFGMPKA